MRPPWQTARDEAVAFRDCRAAVARLAALGAVVVLAGCVSRQVYVRPVSQTEACQERMAGALTADRPAGDTMVVLRRYGLEMDYRSDPDRCLEALWAKARDDARRDALFALAELCFLRARSLDRPAWLLGDRDRARGTYLAAAVSAYLYLFGDRPDPLPASCDRRLRLACELYNAALGRAFADAAGRVILTSMARQTPLGSIDITFERHEAMAAIEALDTVLLADQYAVRGLEIRNRTSGLGAPLIAVKKSDPKRPFRQTLGLSALLHCTESDGQNGRALQGTLRVVMPTDPQEFEVDGRIVPVETDQTAPLAYALSDPLVWKLGRRVFRLGQSSGYVGIYPSGPYVPGRIPVLFVHGTMSSPFLWADMLNSLRADPDIQRRCQFWFYFYESSRPLGVSAARLRESITETLATMDPEGRDPAMQQMVVIGHSQGGILAKLTAVDTGEAMIQALTGRSLAELNLSAADSALVQRYTMFTPLPQVRRVVFISTPHRGSYRASGLTRGLVRRLVRLPTDLTQVGTLLDSFRQRFSLPPEFRRLPTSIDGMSPGNPTMLRLAEIPVAAGVQAHSIIPIKGNETPPEGKDGVVAYRSAHLEGVESEFVVRDGHSCQGNPLVIEEVRRILLEHLKPGMSGRPESGR